MNIQIIPTDDKIYSRELIKLSMKPYLEKHGIILKNEQFEPNWLSMNNFEILCDNVTVGVVRLENDNESCTIRDLHIEKTHQGRGIGSAVVKQIISDIKEQGLQSLRLNVFDSNPAIELYKRLGFVQVEQDGFFVRMKIDL